MRDKPIWRRFGGLVLITGTSFGVVAAAEPRPAAELDYRREIWPIIEAKCVECHQAKKQQGGLDMSTRAAMLKGGASGAAFVPGNVEKSLMLELIEFGEMPPRKNKKPPVTKDEFQKLSRWVAAGGLVPDEPEPNPSESSAAAVDRNFGDL
jgi:hypothetical protein